MLGKRKLRNNDNEQGKVAKLAKLEVHKQKLPASITIELVNEQNKSTYKQQVLVWLESDYNKKKTKIIEQWQEHQEFTQDNHSLDVDEIVNISGFWNNRDQISDAFEQCQAMVALNNQGKAIGFLTWQSNNHASVDIAIVKVQKDYRRQGIFKTMLAELCAKYSDMYVLSASALPKAQKVYEGLGWKNSGKNRKYYKILKEGLAPEQVLTDWPVIAICAEDFYAVRDNKEKYKNQMQYFPLDLANDWQLAKPILAEVIPNSFGELGNYMGIYCNKELIAEGKPKHLLNDEVFEYAGNLLIIHNFHLLEKQEELCKQKDFFKQQLQASREASISNSAIVNFSSKANRPLTLFDHPWQQAVLEETSRNENDGGRKSLGL